jgi:hypothetical protein
MHSSSGTSSRVRQHACRPDHEHGVAKCLKFSFALKQAVAGCECQLHAVRKVDHHDQRRHDVEKHVEPEIELAESPESEQDGDQRRTSADDGAASPASGVRSRMAQVRGGPASARGPRPQRLAVGSSIRSDISRAMAPEEDCSAPMNDIAVWFYDTNSFGTGSCTLRQCMARKQGASKNSKADGGSAYFHVSDFNRLRPLIAVVLKHELDRFTHTDLLDLLGQFRQATDRLAVRHDDDVPSSPVEALTPCKPARAAGEPGTVRTTITRSTPSLVAMVSLPATMPMPGAGTRPLRMSSGTMRFTISTGIAKPIPAFDPRAKRSPCSRR